MAWFILGCFLSAFVISCAVTGVVRKLAPRLGLVDQPAARKVHTTPTPLGGGIGIWAGVVMPLAVVQLAAWFFSGGNVPDWMPAEIGVHMDGVLYKSGQLWLLLLAASLLFVMGLWDDFRNLPWKPRLIGQFGVAIFLVYIVGVRGTVFVDAPIVGEVLTILWILVLVNALNFLDNMDGLTGGIALVASLVFAAIMLGATGEPRWLVGGVLLVLAGSAAGFLVHNWSPAKIFMGDGGSYFIGCLLASLTVLGTFYSPGVSGTHVMLAPLFILAVALYDFCSVMLIRLKERRSPFEPDKRHFSHRLVEMGLKPSHAVLTIHLATLITGMGAILLYAVDSWRGAIVNVALIVCVLALVAILETAGRNNDSPDNGPQEND